MNLDLPILYGGLSKFRSYLFDGYCKTEARIWICLLECLTMQCNLFVNKGIICQQRYNCMEIIWRTSKCRSYLFDGYCKTGAWIWICLLLYHIIATGSILSWLHLGLYKDIGPTPLVGLVRLKLEFGFASFIWRTI